MYKYINKYYESAMKQRPGFIPANHSFSEEKFMDRLTLTEFIALYTKKIDGMMCGENIKLNPIGIKLYLDYIKSIKANWIVLYYKIIDNVIFYIKNNNINKYNKIRFIFLNIIDLYLKKYGSEKRDDKK